PPIDLFAQLGGTPDTGGTWMDPNGVPNNGTMQPGVDPFGAYTYIAGNACLFNTATVTVTSASPSPGTNGNLALCADGAPADLFAALGGAPDPGGSWSGPGGAMNGTFDPAVNAPGVYTYTVAGAAGC
ncbi:hypothetical protein V6O07_16805, partial [Arthrospira platensis SPKY2]